MAQPKLILASSSPRRQEILEGLGLEFEVRPVSVDEGRLRNELAFCFLDQLVLVNPEEEDAAQRQDQDCEIERDQNGCQARPQGRSETPEGRWLTFPLAGHGPALDVRAEPVSDGGLGELVFTTLSREAMPIIRYRTRDIASLTRTPCPCGRSGVRMSRIKGRSDDMLVIRGVNVFPSQIEEALLRVDGKAAHYMIEVDRPGTLDELTIRVEAQGNDLSDRAGNTAELEQRFQDSIYATAGVRAEVILATPGTLTRSEGKAARVLDRRRL